MRQVSGTTDREAGMELHERDERRAAAEARLGDLAEAGVVGVVLPWLIPTPHCAAAG
jgi:hypothetical protein